MMYQVKEKRKRRPEELSNRELFQRGLKGWLDNEQASALYKEFKDNLKSFRNLTLEELESKGMSKKDAFKLSALLELFQRSEADENAYREQIMSSQQVARRLMSEIGGNTQEHLRVYYLDVQNRIIQEETVFIGGVSRSIAEPREILHYGVKYMATSIIVSHNHPSGEIYPSRNDIDFTHKMKRSCDDLGIVLLDHLIVSKDRYYSFREEREDLDLY